MTTQFAAQKQQFISYIETVAHTSYRATDARTSTLYFLGDDDLVYSTDRNYSILGGGAGMPKNEFIEKFTELSKGYAIAELNVKYK
ncbi:hypothetical protein [Pedobacter sp.]